MSCPCNTSGHVVSREGFLLLEAVEGAFASAEQQIEKISVWVLRESEGLLSALSSRAERQQEKISNLKLLMKTIHLDDLYTAKLLHSLLKNCNKATTCWLNVTGEIGMEGWEALAQAVGSHPGILYSLRVSKKVMLTAKAQDLKTIHNAIQHGGGWGVMENVDCTGKCIKFIGSEEQLEEFLAGVEEEEEAVDQGKSLEQEDVEQGARE